MAQIGVVKLGLEDDFPILDTLRLFVVPIDRNGQRIPLGPFFTRLTGITESDIDADGVSLDKALQDLVIFSDGARFWSWGKDEFNMIAISCYVEGFAPPIPATRFGNACDLLLKAGMPYADLKKTRSNALAAYYGIKHPELKKHDALDDALSVAYVTQHLLADGRLSPVDFN